MISCTRDAKGDYCAEWDMVRSNAREYCPDGSAPGRCDEFVDVLLDMYVRCISDDTGDLDKEYFRNQLEEDGLLPDCEDAVATSGAADDCVTYMMSEEACLEGAGQPNPLPEYCDGAIIFPDPADAWPRAS